MQLMTFHSECPHCRYPITATFHDIHNEVWCPHCGDPWTPSITPWEVDMQMMTFCDPQGSCSPFERRVRPPMTWPVFVDREYVIVEYDPAIPATQWWVAQDWEWSSPKDGGPTASHIWPQGPTPWLDYPNL